MGFSIVSSAPFSGNMPVFGKWVEADSLGFALRANSDSNLVDVSGNGHEIDKVGEITFTDAGVSSSNNYLQTNFDSDSDDAFTLYATFSLDFKTDSAIRKWLAGTYVSGAVGGIGIYIRTENDSNNSGKQRILARGTVTRRNSVGSQVPTYIDVILKDNLTSLTDLGWTTIALRVDANTGMLQTDNLTNSTYTSTSKGTNDYSAEVRYGNKSEIPKMRVLSSGSSVVGDHVLQVSEVAYWSKALSNNELQNQYKKTKDFMKNVRGIDL